jgi:hypothetical protein
LSVPDPDRLSKQLDECLDARDRMITHAEHLQEDLLGALETIGRIRRLLARWRQDRIYTQDHALASASKTAELNALEKRIEELETELNNIPLFADEPPERKRDDQPPEDHPAAARGAAPPAQGQVPEPE